MKFAEFQMITFQSTYTMEKDRFSCIILNICPKSEKWSFFCLYYSCKHKKSTPLILMKNHADLLQILGKCGDFIMKFAEFQMITIQSTYTMGKDRFSCIILNICPKSEKWSFFCSYYWHKQKKPIPLILKKNHVDFLQILEKYGIFVLSRNLQNCKWSQFRWLTFVVKLFNLFSFDFNAVEHIAPLSFDSFRVWVVCKKKFYMEISSHVFMWRDFNLSKWKKFGTQWMGNDIWS